MVQFAQDTQTPSQGWALPLLQYQHGSALPCLSLLVRSHFCTQFLERGLLAALNSDFRGSCFLGRILADTQTVTKLCGFRKRAYILHLKCTAGAFSHLLNHLVSPILLSSVSQGDQSAPQSQHFQTVSPGKAFVQEQDGFWDLLLHCMAGASPISSSSSVHITLGRRSASAPSPTCLWELPPMGLQEIHFVFKDINILKVIGWKEIYYAIGFIRKLK